MKFLNKAALAATALYASTTSADPVQVCPNSDVCFRVAVPSSSASSGSGNIYFQLVAPSTYQWIGLGTGTGMSGANIFLMYQDGNGNITLSPRRGRGHIMPQYASDGAQLTLLAGSGVSNGNIIANVRCSNCQSWSGGSMSLSSTSSNWLSAWKAGSALNSASVSEQIQQHDDHAQFTINLSQATISADQNPFVDSSGAPTTPGSDDTGGGDSSSGGGGGATITTGGSRQPTLMIVHGVLMSVAFVILFPLGSILMPLMGKWVIHAAWQTIAFLVMWAGVAIGIIFGRDLGILFQQTHTLLGICVVCLMVLQPFLGYAHHVYYVRNQRRGLISHVHIWYGRALIIIGIVNGGLGLQLTNCPVAFKIAYSVVAGVLALAYLGSAAFGARRRRRNPVRENFSKESQSSPR